MKFEKEIYLSHVEKDKIYEMKKLLDAVKFVYDKHLVFVTNFLDPYEINLAKSILNRFDEINYCLYGGFQNSERKIIYIYPIYMTSIENDKIDRICFKKKSNISHKDVLGSILALGINRNKIGDIVVNSEFIHIFVKKEIADFIKFNLEKVSNTKVEFSNCVFFKDIEKFYENTHIIKSLRLDVFLASVLKFSRNEINNLIKSQNVKVNFKTELSSSYRLSEGDLISIKKFGRVIFYRLEEKTKKGNYIVKTRIPK